MIAVETLEVVVGDQSLTIPAYTRRPKQLAALIETYMAVYLRKSDRDNAGVSVGDFALYLLAQAEKEPRTIAG